MKKTIIILLTLLWCIVIFIFSSMSGNESNEKSKETINNVIDTTLEVTNDSGITDKHPSEKKINSVIEKLNRPLRKCMHASVYFVLAILVFLSFKSFKINGWKLYVLPILICFIYACTDEFHQYFVSGRTSEFTDVLIDTGGAIVGIMVAKLVSKVYYKIKKV